jgi:hypothetical protein
MGKPMSKPRGNEHNAETLGRLLVVGRGRTGVIKSRFYVYGFKEPKEVADSKAGHAVIARVMRNYQNYSVVDGVVVKKSDTEIEGNELTTDTVLKELREFLVKADLEPRDAEREAAMIVADVVMSGVPLEEIMSIVRESYRDVDFGGDG